MGFRIQVKAPDQLHRKVPHIVMDKVKNTNDGRKRRKTLDCLKGGDCMQSAPHGDRMRRHSGASGLGINQVGKNRSMLKTFVIGLALSLPYRGYKEG